MALYPIAPHEVAQFASANYIDICPAISIISDYWKNELTSTSSPSFIRHVSSTNPLCLGPDRRIAEKLVLKPLPRYDFLDPPGIAWLDPKSLIPHEPTSPVHLARLINYLRDLDNDALLPTIIVTKSTPHVILDGHHRWQSSLTLGISRVPCWVVDDDKVDVSPYTLLPVPHTQFMNSTVLYSHIYNNNHIISNSYAYYQVRVYDTRAQVILRIRDIADKARAAYAEQGNQSVGFGVKGTKHVAIRVPTLASAPVLPIINTEESITFRMGSITQMKSSSYYTSNTDNNNNNNNTDNNEEVRLEKVAPLIEWGLWKSAGIGYCPNYLNSINVAELRPILGLDEAGVSLILDSKPINQHDDTFFTMDQHS